MKLHHTLIKKAEKLGYILELRNDHVAATLPRRGVVLTGVSAVDLMAAMDAFLQIDKLNDDYNIYDGDLVGGYRLVDKNDDRLLNTEFMPMKALIEIANDYADGTGTPVVELDEKNTIETADLPIDVKPQPALSVERHSEATYTNTKGKLVNVPVDGAIAYAEGVVMGDNPFDEGSDESDAWEIAWDNAADAAPAEDGEGSGSVVGERYRAKYAEAGHPTHCGDWLAETLNSIVVNKGGTNLELFEQICGMNGVDTSKYKRDGVGWQGRLRMTGRNLLAKAVYAAGGKLNVPQGEEVEVKQAPKEWMDLQRFKTPKVKQAPAVEEVKA